MPHSSGFARLASGAFYFVVSMMTFCEFINLWIAIYEGLKKGFVSCFRTILLCQLVKNDHLYPAPYRLEGVVIGYECVSAIDQPGCQLNCIRYFQFVDGSQPGGLHGNLFIHVGQNKLSESDRISLYLMIKSSFFSSRGFIKTSMSVIWEVKARRFPRLIS